MRLRDAYWLGVQRHICASHDPKLIICQLSRLIVHPTKLVNVLAPIDYVRYREFEFVLEAIKRYGATPYRVLDIGSPKLLALTLAASMPRAVVHSVDILHAEASTVSNDAKRLGIHNLVSEVQDARSLGYADNSCDLILSVSVFEHIAPEHDGEVPASRELWRILARNGIAVLTVPFSRTYFSESRAGQVYERVSGHAEPIFFQRFYDYDLLMCNIIHASWLDLLYLGFIEERFFCRNPRKRLAHYVNSSPRQNLLFGLFWPILSRVFLTAPKPLDACKKPYVACFVLRKP